LDDARLLGPEELVPERVEGEESIPDLDFGDGVVVVPRGPPCAHDDIWLVEDGAKLVNDDTLDLAGRHARFRL
jgi:hypothetical protein